MAQTMSQRPPAIRESSCPSTSAASSSRPLPARAQSDLLPETNSQRANPRRSIIGRILRASGNDNIEELNDGSGAEDTERKRKPTPSGKWEKRASRKAPTPPSRVMPGMERRHPRERSSPRIDENGFERVRENVNIPKVFLFPPEEGESAPLLARSQTHIRRDSAHQAVPTSRLTRPSPTWSASIGKWTPFLRLLG